MRSVSCVAASLAVALVAVPAAFALDVDGDGRHDAQLREQPYLPFANSGTNCDAFDKGNVPWARLSVRPPRVWIQLGLSFQDVAWRAVFYDFRNNHVVARSRWEQVRLRQGQFTDFGGNDYPGINIYWKPYWSGSHYYDHPLSDGVRLKALVQVRWAQVAGGFKHGTMRPVWVVPTRHRTDGVPSVWDPMPRLSNATCG